MLRNRDCFVFDCGKCSFKSPGGRTLTLNDRMSWSNSTAHIAIQVFMLVAERLQVLTECTIEVEPSTGNRATYEFKRPPESKLLAGLRRIELTRESINASYKRAGLLPPSAIKEAINHHGAEAFA